MSSPSHILIPIKETALLSENGRRLTVGFSLETGDFIL